MKRPLNEQEKKATEAGVERLKKEIKHFKINLDYARDTMELQEKGWAKDDKYREFMRELKREADKREVEALNDQIKMSENNLNNSLKQLKEGVEIKKVNAVGE